MSLGGTRAVVGALGTSRIALAAILSLAGVGLAGASGNSWAASSLEDLAWSAPRSPTGPGEAGGRPTPGTSILENQGQVADPGVYYYASGEDFDVGFRESGVDFVLRAPGGTSGRAGAYGAGPSPAALVRLEFEGSRRVAPVGAELLAHPTHFLLGNDPAYWRTSLRSYKEVWYRGLYEGVDLVYRVDPSVKYEFLVGPGGDPGQIRMRYDGAERLQVVDGDLVLTMGVAGLRDTRPVAYQGQGAVPCDFRLSAAVASFRCDWDPGQILRIDPLVYATYLGGGGGGWVGMGWDIAIDAQGSAFVAGRTSTPTFPTTPGAFDTVHSGNQDVYVVKLNPDGTAAVFSTFLGGAEYEEGRSLAIDGSGAVYVTGSTTSVDFPTTPGTVNRTYSGRGDAFVAKLSPAGDALVYSTYLGGRDGDVGHDIAVDETGVAYVAGETYSDDFPITAGAWDSGFFYSEAFVSKLDASGASLLFSTFVGGDLLDTADGIAIDASHTVYITGSSMSSDFPTTAGAFQPALAGQGDAFVCHLDELGQSAYYCTLLGGQWWDLASAIAVGTDGSAYVTGNTGSANFPITPGAADSTIGNEAYGGDAFVSKLNPSGSSLVYSTFLGGQNGDHGYAIAVDAEGWAYVVGSTSSWDFPITPGALNLTTTYAAFLVRLNATGAYAFSTLLGGDNFTDGFGLAIDGKRNAYLTGTTSANDFPITPNAYNRTAWNGDGYVAKILANRPPIADAGLDLSARVGDTVQLNGSGSSDPEGDPLSVTWSQTGGPPIGLNDPNGWNPVLVPALEGNYVFELTVSDPYAGQASDTVIVHAWEPPPVTTASATPSPQEYGQPVTFAAMVTDDTLVATVSVEVRDAGGAPVGNFTMTYNATSARYETTQTVLELGTLSFTVWANDTSDNWSSASGTFVIQDTTNPVADAGEDQNVDVGDEVPFDGSGSSDNHGIENWTWTFETGGHTVTLYGEAAGYAFSSAGSYEVTLAVRDESGNEAEDVVMITVNAPSVDAVGMPIWAWVITGIAMVAAIASAFLFMRRRKGSAAVAPAPEPAAPPELPPMQRK